jgi:hypothetical protein
LPQAYLCAFSARHLIVVLNRDHFHVPQRSLPNNGGRSKKE